MDTRALPVKRLDEPKVPGAAGLVALVLAGGAGRRFGAAFEAPVEEVIVVTGSESKVAPAAEAFALRRGEAARLRLVHADDWSEGLSASLRAGLAAVAPGRLGAFVFLGDMPDVPAGLPHRLAAAFAPGAAAVAPVLDGEPGHPALLGAELFAAVMRLTGDRGARLLMEAQGDRFVRVPVQDRGVLFDVDTRQLLESG